MPTHNKKTRSAQFLKKITEIDMNGRIFEKVNPQHPDKVADRIAGAMVDLAYNTEENPRVAVEVLIGHGYCHIIAESSIMFGFSDVEKIVHRITGDEEMRLTLYCVPQDKHLADNQSNEVRCGDNGIFKGVPTSDEEKELTAIAHKIYDKTGTDGKYIIDTEKQRLIVCQSNATQKELMRILPQGNEMDYIINPLGEWTGGTDVDTGATNRKLGSDMGRGVTGGGLHGKDLSKADVSVNIYAHLLAQKTGHEVELSCAIGDKSVGGVPYVEIVEQARQYIRSVGGFERFAEWGLIR